MAESEASMSTEEGRNLDSPHNVKKPKKRSIVERELETSLTTRVTSPMSGDGINTSRYGRARRLKTEDADRKPNIDISSKIETPIKSPSAYKMHAINSPYKTESPKHTLETSITKQIDSIYQENLSLSRFNNTSLSPAKKSTKVYMRKDLIQTKDEDDGIVLIKNLFSPTKSNSKTNVSDSTEKFNGSLLSSDKYKNQNRFDTASVVKTLDFDDNNKGKKRKENNKRSVVVKSEPFEIEAVKTLDFDDNNKGKKRKENNKQSVVDKSEPFEIEAVKTLEFDDNNKGKKRKENNKRSVVVKSEPFEIEAQSPYQVGDLAWARMGTFPFWPCIVTRDPQSGTFVRKKLFGRVEHNILHVTFFGDNGRRSWVVDNMLRPYQGRQEFEATRDKFTAENKKKDPRLYAAFFISEKKQHLWNISVEEAELLMKEPKRLRIDILNDMIHKARDSRKQQKSGKISRTNSDVSLSESLYDSLFSEDDTKTDDQGRLRSRSRNHKSFDVSEVVTACLDNMAAKTGITKIQRQSHMDRWLQKAKSKTPEKPQNKVIVKTERNTRNTRSRNTKPKKSSVKSAITKDESNFSEQDIKNIKIKTDYSNSDDTTTPTISLFEDVTVKLELIEQENEKEDEGKLNDVITNAASADEIEASNDKGLATDNVETSKDNVADNQTMVVNNEQNMAGDSKTIDVISTVSVDKNVTVENNYEIDKTKPEEQPLIGSKKDLDGEVSIAKETLAVIEVKEQKMPENPNNVKVSISPENTPIIKSKADGNSVEHSSLFSKHSETMDVPSKNGKNSFDKTYDISNDTDKNDGQNDSVLPAAETMHIEELPKNCEPMEVDTSEQNNESVVNSPIGPEVLPKSGEPIETIANSSTNSQNKPDEKNNQPCIFLDERSGVDKHPVEKDSNQTSNFLDDDHNHLRDKNINDQEKNKTEYFFDKDVNNQVIDNVVEKDLENHDCGRHKDLDSKSNHETSIDDDDILDKIDDILNDSGESESILQSGALNFDEKGSLNSVKLVDNHKPKDSIETIDIDKDFLYKGKQICLKVSSEKNEEIVESTTLISLDTTNNLILGSSTPKQNNKLTTALKETKPSNNVPEFEEYEIEDSDEEPSPEYEPLGDEITEDFRQHMKCIENSVTDKKDEEQLVKICDELTKTIKMDSSVISPKKDLPQPIVKSPKDNVSISIEKSAANPLEQNEKFSPQINALIESSPPLQKSQRLTREFEQETIDSTQKYLPRLIVKIPKDNVLKSIEKAAKSLEHNVTISPQIKAINESTPPQKSEGRVKELRSKDKSGKHRCLSLNKYQSSKSNENIVSESSPQEPVKKETETLNLSTTPHRTRSRTKKFDLSKQDNHELKINNIIENGDIHENHVETHSPRNHHQNKYDTQVNGPIQEIYAKMCQNEPKVMLTPLKTHNYVKFDEKPDDKNRKSPNKFKLSLKKVKSPDPNQDDFYTIVKDETKRKKPKMLPIENGLETTIPVSHQNGYHHDKDKDADVDIDKSSVNSDDNDDSVIVESPRRSLRTRNLNSRSKRAEFLHYLELRQDYLMDEYTELNDDEVDEYLHRTWEYEESSKCDDIKSDDIRNSNLVKGIKQESPNTPNNKKSKKSKPKAVSNTMENYFPDIYQKKKLDMKSEPVVKLEDNLMDSQPGCSNSSDSGIESNKDKNEMEIDITIKSPPKLPASVDLTDLNYSNDSKMLRHQVKEATDNPIINENTSTPKNLSSDTTLPKPLKSEKEHPRLTIKDEKAFDSESLDSDSEIPLRQLRSKVLKDKQNPINSIVSPSVAKLKHESDDVILIDSDDEPLNKHFKKKKTDKNSENRYSNPDFVKFLLLRQDAVMDDNPELSKEEIVDYLYKIWLYEESSKTELEKNDDIEQSNLVKGLNQDSVPKKVKRKPKTEKVEKDKTIDIDDVIPREKPRRKTVQPFYNEEFYSDIEDQIELFEIFRKKPTVKKEEKDPVVKDKKTDNTNEIKQENRDVQSLETNKEIDLTNDVEQVDDCVEILDSWESYFADLLKPKPNVFKGLIREKVCEVCEQTGNLYKCKGCNGMFHPDCLKKSEEVIEINTPNKGRKKKRKPRKNKSLEEFESQDEKCQDSESPQNVSIEETMSETCTFDAETLDAQISAKMQEILNSEEYKYDSYSSDDGGVDWTETVPGKCEIIDVKLKPKRPPVDYSNFKCSNCQEHDTPVCFVCKQAVSKNNVKMRQKCHNAHCHKYYHLECLDHWPQTQFLSGEPSRNNKKINEFFEALSCPQHVCHTCVSDDPRGCKTRFSGDKLARCVRCPATYHSFTKCLPAGSQILTASQIICPRHYQHRPGKVPCHVNTGWCFICALGGSLICCEYCPTSFHAECLNIKPPEGNYMCEDCETGRLPLYGEMVWVKLGHYRWWPGIILHPSEIPENIMAVKHGLGEFVVRFFGQYDHYWVNRGRVFPYQEGDSGRISNQKTKIDADFTTAMEHAQRAFEILKNANPNEEESLDIASSLLPPRYVKLKCNKPCGTLVTRREDPALSLTQCECNPDECDPCGPYSQCLNRMLLTECGPTCRAGERCNNRAFEKRLYPKLTPYRTPHRGWGLKTLEDIKAGQFVIEYVGELIDEEEFRRRMRRKHEIRDENFYFLTLDKERMIDAGPKGNLARFMNHCCEPNCETQKWTVLGDIRVGLFAINDIPANSEVTFNYNLECAGIDKKRCMCGAKRCAGYIGAKPKQDETQTKKSKDGKLKRAYKKRKIDENNKTNKQKKPLGRPPKPKELTEIEKDLLIIKSATTNSSGESSTSSRSQSIEEKNSRLKKKRESIDDEKVIEGKIKSATTNSSGESSTSSRSQSIEEKNSRLKKKRQSIDDEKVIEGKIKSATTNSSEESSTSSRSQSTEEKNSRLKRKRDSIDDEKVIDVKRQKCDDVGD